MESGSLNHELLKFFEYDSSVPTGSAFYQQRSKLSVSAFRHLLKEFNLKFPLEKFRDNYYDIWAAVQSDRTDTAVRTITAPTIAIFSGISKHEADPNKRGQES